MAYAQTLMVDDATGDAIPAVLCMTPAGISPEQLGNFHRLLVRRGFEVVEPPMSVAGAREVPSSAQVRLAGGGFRVVIHTWEHAPLIDDPGAPPTPPPGWWEAVTAFGDQCVVVISPRIDVTTDPTAQLTDAAHRQLVLTGRATVVRQYP